MCSWKTVSALLSVMFSVGHSNNLFSVGDQGIVTLCGYSSSPVFSVQYKYINMKVVNSRTVILRPKF